MQWKDIKGYDGYQVSDTGLVRTHNKTTYTEWHGTRHWRDRILVPKIRTDGKRGGDARVDLWKDGKSKTFKISRLVAFTFYDEDIFNNDLTVNHIDGDWTNNNLSNLELVTLKDNIKHGFENGLYDNVCKSTKIYNKIDKTTTTYRSMSAASQAMGYNQSYLSDKIQKGKTENKRYRWEIIKGD